MTGPASPARPNAVKSADRTVELLEVLSASDRPLTLTELHRELSYPKSSLYMLLQTLVARGWGRGRAAHRRQLLSLRAGRDGR